MSTIHRRNKKPCPYIWGGQAAVSRRKEGELKVIKGCHKKVIWIRDTESDIFDEAYFILSDEACKRSICESDMIKEARRLVSASPVGNYWSDVDTGAGAAGNGVYAKQSRRLLLVKTVYFALGFSVSAVPLLALLLLTL